MEASVRITCAFFFGIDGISDIHSGIRDCKLEWELFKKIDGRYLLARIVPNGQYSGMWRLAVLNPGYILPISYLTTYKNLSRIIERPYIRCDAEEVFRLKISGEHILRFPTNFSGMTIEHLIDVALDANEADNREFLTANSSKNEFIGYMPSYTSYTPMSFNDDGTVTAARVEDEGCEKEINSTIEQMREQLTPLIELELRQKVGPVEPVGAEAALYTDEDKVFCVKRMWAEGLTPTAASRLWGAPSRRTLAAWEKEALGGGLAVEAPRVPGACRRAKHARYPEETRAEALRLLGLGKPTREIARALGLPSGSVVSRWAAEARRRAKMAPEAIAMGKEKGAPGPREAELDRLRMECAVLREMLSDPKAGDPARLSNRQKAELGERLRRDYGFRLRRVTAFLRISKSSYEYERRALAAPRRDDGALAARVARAFASLGGMCVDWLQ